MRMLILCALFLCLLTVAGCGSGDGGTTSAAETTAAAEATDSTDSTDDTSEESRDEDESDEGEGDSRPTDKVDGDDLNGGEEADEADEDIGIGEDTRPPTDGPAPKIDPLVAVEPNVAPASGGDVYISVLGFPPNTTVDLLAGPPNSEASPIGKVRTDAEGIGIYTLNIPGGSPGTLVILACQNSCATKVQTRLTLQ